MWPLPPTVTRSLDIGMLTVARGEGKREFFGFDTFCQHSCEPSMETVYESEDASRPDLGVTGNELCDPLPPLQPTHHPPATTSRAAVILCLPVPRWCWFCCAWSVLCLLCFACFRSPPDCRLRPVSRRKFCYTALRPIRTGEELSCDYESFDPMLDGSTFECRCGAPTCRKLIRG